MLGDYVLHFPLTDFAVGLLVIAAVLDLGRIVLKRPQWQVAIDLLLLLGFVGAAVSVGSGLWLVSAQGHGHSRDLSIHHWFAYGTLGVSAAGVVAHVLARRRPKLAAIKTVSLVLSAALVSGAGFFGGKMAHPATEVTPHSHDGAPSDSHAPTETKPHGHDGTTNDSHAPAPGSDTKPAETKPAETKPAETKPAETTPHDHGGDSHPTGSGAQPDAKPAGTKPTVKPTETKPTQTKPTETKPTETKPGESHEHHH